MTRGGTHCEWLCVFSGMGRVAAGDAALRGMRAGGWDAACSKAGRGHAGRRQGVTRGGTHCEGLCVFSGMGRVAAGDADLCGVREGGWDAACSKAGRGRAGRRQGVTRGGTPCEGLCVFPGMGRAAAGHTDLLGMRAGCGDAACSKAGRGRAGRRQGVTRGGTPCEG